MGAEPIVIVLIFSSLAAVAALAGVIPQALRGQPSAPLIGWGNALAAGLMLGVAYTLLTVGLRYGLAQGGLGALLGIALVRATHAMTGTAELDVVDPHVAAPDEGRRTLLRDTLHAAHEGVAIGVAMLVSIPLGIAMAVSLAAHNVPEAMALTAVLTRRGSTLLRAGGLAVTTNLNQVLLAVLTFALVSAVPWLLPWVTGFAVGALLYLVLAELLPQAYRQAGHTSIALVTLVAMGVLVMLTGGAA